MKQVSITKGERIRVLSKFSNSLEVVYRFNAEPVNAGDTLSGTVEVSGSNWIFPKPSRSQPLMQENEVKKGVWDTFYSVTVQPDCDVSITFHQNSMGFISQVIVLAALIIAAAVSVAIFAYTF